MSWGDDSRRAAGARSRAAPVSYVRVEDVPASWDRYGAIERSLTSVPQGLVLHLAGPTDEGFRIVEVWSSEADWEAFAASLDVAIAQVDPVIGAVPVVRAFSTAHVVMGDAAGRGAPWIEAGKPAEED